MHLRQLDANLLVVLDALLLEASVTKAAERLGRSPSAVSHALSSLRHIFADDLFVRAGQRLVPTARALEVAPQVAQVVAGMELLLVPKRPFDPAQLSRSFVVTANEVCELTLLHGLRETLKEEAPGVVLAWRNLRVDHVVADLRGNLAQFVLADTDASREGTEDIKWRHLYDDPCVTLARPGHPLSARRLTPAQFTAAEHVLIGGEEGQGARLEAHFLEKGLRLNVAMRASSIFAGLFLALDSYYLVTVPGSVARAIRKRVPFAVIQQPFPPLQRRKSLGWHRAQDGDPAHSWLRQRIIARVEAMIGD